MNYSFYMQSCNFNGIQIANVNYTYCDGNNTILTGRKRLEQAPATCKPMNKIYRANLAASQ